MEFLFQFTPDQVVLTIGFSLVMMFARAQFGIFEKILDTGDAAATIKNIDSSVSMFWIAVAGWVIVYALDAVISLGLYVMFRSTNEARAHVLKSRLKIHSGGCTRVFAIICVWCGQ